LFGQPGPAQAASDVKTQEFLRKVSDDHLRLGLFAIDMLSWPDIVSRLSANEEVLEQILSWRERTMETHGTAGGRNSRLDQEPPPPRKNV
jgi:hypothetical protein